MDSTPLTSPSTVLPTTDSKPAPTMPRLTEIPITDDNAALNVMVGFLDTAQKRGAFSLDESAKVWECVKRFIQKSDSATL
tara:strand:- start:99 stop:338 length:240 start_codon:yes stop_codon:yes gene_type:complete